jgi:hypothetical protein
MAASGAASTSHGTSIARNHVQGSVNGEAHCGLASKKNGT